LRFESGSKLTRIEAREFYGCSSLESICLPASLQKIDGSALAHTRISMITVEEGNIRLVEEGNIRLESHMSACRIRENLQSIDSLGFKL
jgi:hypothetical protein